jgi:FkbM family methyltransferase
VVLLYKRAIWGIAQRLGRTDVLGVIDAEARQALREDIAVEALLASLLTSNQVYVDVGANRGQTLREAVRVAPYGRHLAFEPIPGLAATVTREFPSVDCRALALGARRQSARFCHFTKLDGWSGLRRASGLSDAQGRPTFIDVQVSTLDDELTDVTARVIKIDVEGAEQDVLEGGVSVISRTRPVVIFEHVREAAALYGNAFEAPWDLLTDLGYRIFSVTGEGPFTRTAFGEASTQVNWLATPEG